MTMSKLGWGALGLCALASPAMAQSASFFDGFDSLRNSHWYVADGWANGAHQNCGWSSKEISLKDGIVSVGFSKNPAAQNRAYRCGEIQTRAAFSYGTFEARLKTPAGSGLNAAFFTYGGPPTSPIHDEIDFEALLKDTSVIQAGGYVQGKTVKGKLVTLPAASDSTYIDYAIVWEPGRTRYYVNGQLGHTVESPAPVQTEPQKIFFSLWGSDTFTEWLGPFEDPGQPIAMQVDWVAYTAPGEHCLFPKSVTCTMQ